MSFKLVREESFDQSVKRVVREQIDNAIECLESKVADQNEAIHDARVATKKIRAVLRLIRHSLGAEIYDSENKAFRDAARGLAKIRDSAAMLELEILQPTSSQDQLESIKESIRKALEHKNAGLEAERVQAMSEAAESLRGARERIDSWPEISAFTKGLRRVFKEGRDGFEVAFELRTADAMHNWRKSVKHLLYQTRLLRPIWPSMLKALTDDLKELQDFLSEDHDLAILKIKIAEMDLAAHEMDALIDESRNEAQRRAHSLGARIYAERPRAFVKRIEAAWHEWKDENPQRQLGDSSDRF